MQRREAWRCHPGHHAWCTEGMCKSLRLPLLAAQDDEAEMWRSRCALRAFSSISTQILCGQDLRDVPLRVLACTIFACIMGASLLGLCSIGTATTEEPARDHRF